MSNILKMIDCIQKNKDLMDAQVNKLSELSPDFTISAAGGVNDSTSLLNAVIHGNVNGVANVLTVMTEVKTDFCKKTAQQNQTNRCFDSNIIDVEVK